MRRHIAIKASSFHQLHHCQISLLVIGDAANPNWMTKQTTLSHKRIYNLNFSFTKTVCAMRMPHVRHVTSHEIISIHRCSRQMIGWLCDVTERRFSRIKRIWNGHTLRSVVSTLLCLNHRDTHIAAFTIKKWNKRPQLERAHCTTHKTRTNNNIECVALFFARIEQCRAVNMQQNTLIHWVGRTISPRHLGTCPHYFIICRCFSASLCRALLRNS